MWQVHEIDVPDSGRGVCSGGGRVVVRVILNQRSRGRRRGSEEICWHGRLRSHWDLFVCLAVLQGVEGSDQKRLTWKSRGGYCEYIQFE
jgi:hypothetical protein